jgi:single-strand DNA-binding protein
MINRVVVQGRLVAPPELRYTQAGDPIAKFTLAHNRGFGDKKETCYIDVVCWRKTAETVAQNLDKGRLVAVDGTLWIRSYEKQDGTKGKATEITTDRVEFLDYAKTGTDDLTGLDVGDE